MNWGNENILNRFRGINAFSPSGISDSSWQQPGYKYSGNLKILPTMTPEQQEYYTQLLQGLQGYGSFTPQYEITPEMEEYYQENIYDPAMAEYENVTRPGYLESLGTLHSGVRANLERTSREELARQLRGEKQQYYQNQMNQANQMNLAAYQANMMPYQAMTQAISMPAMENILRQNAQSLMESLF